MPTKPAKKPSRYTPPAGHLVLDDGDLSDAPITVGDDDLTDAPQAVGNPAVLFDKNRKPASAEDHMPPPSGPMQALAFVADLAKGFGKGAVHTALDAGETMGHVSLPGMTGNLRDAVDELYGKPGLSKAAMSAARDDTAHSNTTQQLGGALEGLAEMAIPVSKAAEAVPTVAKAGAKFQNVMAAAKNVPVNVDAPGQVALRINELADRGGSMPMAVRKFLGRVTDPNKAQMTYEEARDFASNISRLSADQYKKLTPAVAREVANLRVTLNQAVAQAAEKAGKGAEYASAMREYAHAMKVRNAVDAAIDGAKRSVPYATAAGAGYWLTSKLRGLLD